MRRKLAGCLIRLAHKIYRPNVTVTVFPGHIRCTAESLEDAQVGVEGYRAMMAAQREATRWN